MLGSVCIYRTEDSRIDHATESATGLNGVKMDLNLCLVSGKQPSCSAAVGQSWQGQGRRAWWGWGQLRFWSQGSCV